MTTKMIVASRPTKPKPRLMSSHSFWCERDLLLHTILPMSCERVVKDSRGSLEACSFQLDQLRASLPQLALGRDVGRRLRRIDVLKTFEQPTRSARVRRRQGKVDQVLRCPVGRAPEHVLSEAHYSRNLPHQVRFHDAGMKCICPYVPSVPPPRQLEREHEVRRLRGAEVVHRTKSAAIEQAVHLDMRSGRSGDRDHAAAA